MTWPKSIASSAMLLATSLVGCSGTKEELQDLAKKNLLFPESAQFGEIYQGSAGGHEYACLMVSGKNRVGTQTELAADAFVKTQSGEWRLADLPDAQSMEDCKGLLESSLSGANSYIGKSTRKVAKDVPFKASKPFNSSEVSWFVDEDGENIILGNASLLTKAGKRISCRSANGTDKNVYLTPDSLYARERMEWLYGNQEQGFLAAKDSPANDFPNGGYERSSRAAVCDDAGNFAFGNLPDGTYFLTVSVVWKQIATDGSARIEGGTLMKRVAVSGGQREKINLGALPPISNRNK